MGGSAGISNVAIGVRPSVVLGATLTMGVLCAASVAIWRRFFVKRLRPASIVGDSTDRSPLRRTTLISSLEDWAPVADDFMAEVYRERLVGMDCEWVAYFVDGSLQPDNGVPERTTHAKSRPSRGKVALLQLAPTNRMCLLIRLSHVQVPEEIAKMLADPFVIKLGVSVFEDASKLTEDYGLQVRGCLDLRYMATSWHSQTGCPVDGYSLASLASQFAGVQMNKANELRCANWERSELTPLELEYAAMDSFAGLAVGLAILSEGVSGRSISRLVGCFNRSETFTRCVERFGLFIDKPFRKTVLRREKADNANTANRRKDRSKGGRVQASAIRKEQKIYKNSILQAPDGEVLCSTDEVKTNWYLKMGLGTLVCAEPLTVRLNFEPRCRAILGGDYYVDERQNQCVVCGSETGLLRKSVVPMQYRKHFPPLMKAHTSHDMVIVCSDCQRQRIHVDAALVNRLDNECPTPVEVPSWKRIKAAASALLAAPEKLPAERKALFERTVREHLGLQAHEQISREQLKTVATLDVRYWLRDHEATHGLRVVRHYGSADGPGLFALESLWRQHFLDSMKPRYLSPKWSTVHNHDAVLMKIATGRDLSGYTVEALLEVLGIDWQRMASLVDKIVSEGLVPRERIVIWDKLEQHTHKDGCT